MKDRCKTFVAAIVLLTIASTQTFAAPPAPEPIPGHVRATLISDVGTIRAGRPFMIGVYLEIERGFHIYWTYPGDTGMPTNVSFTGPQGFEITVDPFPIPRRIQQSPRETVYGYETPVIFTARVTPPGDLRIGDQFTFEASAEWLVCDKATCMPGKGSSSITLKVSDHMGPTNVDAFQRYGNNVAGPKDRLADIAGITSKLDDATHTVTMTIHWKTPCIGVQIYPAGADPAVKIGRITVPKLDGDLTPIAIKLDVAAGQKPAQNRLPILLMFRDSDGHNRGMLTNIPIK